MIHRVPRLVRESAASKPKVLLVDDNRALLERVSEILSDDFDLAGIATDGRQGLDSAAQSDPDVIVLDINMPVMDGFQTFRALEQAGSRAPVVFLSMIDDEEHVNEAFRCGARGYVLKSRIVRDLPSALNHALLGRTFAPSLSALSQLAADGGHAMQLHGDAKSFLDGLAGFFDLALRRGDATCVIATAEVREGLADRLQRRGWDVGAASGHDRYLVIDAADALQRFMRNGLPDPARLAEIAAELDHYRTTVGSTSSRLTIFGNMVMSLSADGNTEAVIALESLWNRLTQDLPFLTLCGYSTSCLHHAVPDLYPRACAEHWVVSHTNDVECY
jgi:DNA-binding NarL/FixJ family response regulator